MAQQFTIEVTYDASGAIRRIKRTTKQMDNLNKSVLTARRSIGTFGRILGAAFAGLSFKSLAETADTVQNVENRIKALSEEGTNLVEVQDRLLEISKETRSSFQGTANLYTRLLLSSKELGKSQEDLFKFTERVNKAIILSGATAREAEAGLIQLSQGLASGALRGDELRSVLEQLPAVADIIAKGLGATRGELRRLGEEGKISAEAIFDAFEVLGEGEIDDKFEKTSTTIGQALEVVKTTITQFITELERRGAVLSRIAEGVKGVGDAVLFTLDAMDNFSGDRLAIEAEGVMSSLGAAIQSTEKEIRKLESREVFSDSVFKRLDVLRARLIQLRADAAKATQGKEVVPVDVEALAKANQEAAQLAIIRRKVLSDAKGPQEKFNLQVRAINEELAKGNITQSEANILLARYGETLQRLRRNADEGGPAGRRIAQLERENNIRRITLTYGEIEGEILRRKLVLESEGVKMTEAQIEALRRELTVRKDLEEAADRREAETDKVKERLAAEKEATELLARQGDAMLGLRNTLNQFAVEANNVNAAVSGIANSFANRLTDTITQFVTTGKASFKEFANALIADIGRIIVRMLVLRSISAIGNSLGFGGGDLVGGIAGARASGGPVNKNKSYLVGENGPEMFTPGANGTITSNKDLQPQAQQAPAPQTNLQVVNVQDPAMIPQAISDGEADDAIINVLSRNSDAIRNIIQ